MYISFFKRILDFILALVLLLLLSPVIIIFFIVLFLVNKGDALFFQTRSGYKGVPFTIIKFKTMLDRKDTNGNLLPDEVRLTQIGIIIRELSIDELPQLINVIKGDMSLVGPRPLLSQYLKRYSTEQIKRLNVRPGITGWAQVNGRNALTWEEKFKCDIEYVEKLSFSLDMKILFKTFWNVFNRKGISADGHSTMEEFMGSEN